MIFAVIQIEVLRADFDIAHEFSILQALLRLRYLRLIEFGNIEFLCEYFGQKVDKKDDDQQDSGNSEGCVILCLGHAQVQLDRKGSAGFEDFFEKSCKGLWQKIAASGGE